MTDKEILQEIEAGDWDCLGFDFPNGLLCCRSYHHSGLHIASTSYDDNLNQVPRYIVGRWSTDYQPLPNFLPPC